jgi:hypothetical protein
MKAYKGFNKDMTCRGFQYEEGKTYHEDEAELCESGFHACLNPLDCLSYYNPAESVYHEVELDDVCSEKSEDSKICGKMIKIGAKLSIAKIVEASIEFIKAHTKSADSESNSGNCSLASNSGYYSLASNSGYCSKSEVTNRDSLAVSSGYQSKARAPIGSAICLCERGEWNGKTYPLIAVKAAIVDGKTLKPDTWYTLKDGEFVEVTEND